MPMGTPLKKYALTPLVGEPALNNLRFRRRHVCPTRALSDRLQTLELWIKPAHNQRLICVRSYQKHINSEASLGRARDCKHRCPQTSARLPRVGGGRWRGPLSGQKPAGRLVRRGCESNPACPALPVSRRRPWLQPQTNSATVGALLSRHDQRPDQASSDQASQR